MPIKNYLVTTFIVAVLTTSGIHACCYRCIETMNENIARITREIDRMFSDDWFDRMRGQREPGASTDGRSQLAIDQEGEAVMVKLQLGTGITKLDASIQDDQLLVEVSEKNQKILLDYEKESNYLTISVGQSSQKKDEKENEQSEAVFFSSTQHGQTLKQAIEFNKAKIEYENGTLTISLPKIAIKEQKTVKKIPVNIK